MLVFMVVASARNAQSKCLFLCQDGEEREAANSFPASHEEGSRPGDGSLP